MRRWEGGQDLHSTGLLGVVEAEQLLLSAEHIILAGGTHANHYLIIKQYPHTSDRDPQANNVFHHMHALNWYRLRSFFKYV